MRTDPCELCAGSGGIDVGHDYDQPCPACDGRGSVPSSSACVKCQRGDHHLCTGYDGPITTHPDSLPLCPCEHQPSDPTRRSED